MSLAKQATCQCPGSQCGAACTAFCGRPDLGPKLFPHRAGAIRRGSRLPQWERRALLFCGRPDLGPKLFRAPGWRHSPRLAAPTNEGGVHCFVGGPTSGRSFFGHRAGAIRRGSRLPQMRVACTAFCGRPDLGAKLFRAPSWRHSPRVAAPAMVAAFMVLQPRAVRCSSARIQGRQRPVFRLAGRRPYGRQVLNRLP